MASGDTASPFHLMEIYCDWRYSFTFPHFGDIWCMEFQLHHSTLWRYSVSGDTASPFHTMEIYGERSYSFTIPHWEMYGECR
jgi:hypothetical protein